MSIISIPQDRFFSNFCKYADISQCFSVRPFFVHDAKNHRDRLNHSCRKTRFKNITIAHLNWFGPPEQFNMLWITVHFSRFKESKEIGTALTFLFSLSLSCGVKYLKLVKWPSSHESNAEPKPICPCFISSH